MLELPENIRDEAYKSLSTEQLAEALEKLETDDATDIIRDIEEFDQNKADKILSNLEKKDQQDINWLKQYDENQAGAFMQVEIFSANINETIYTAIKRLKGLKKLKSLENINRVFIIDKQTTLLGSISLEDLIIFDFNKTFKDIINQDSILFKPKSVKAENNIHDVVQQFEQYNLSVVAVTDDKNKLIGRITSDDILDIVENNATQQLYQLAGVNDNCEHEDNIFQAGTIRGRWLFINLFTAILASIIIAIFDETIQDFIALAILMPIVASMGGNAGTQTLTVMVRRIALGEINTANSKDAIKKEIFISILNGFIFALIMSIIASLWFNTWAIGLVIALSIIITLFSAGFFGSTIPLVLKRFHIDPAIGSTVVLTTVTDIIGFFSFLGLAKLILAP